MHLVYRAALVLGMTVGLVSCGSSSSTTPSGDTGNGNASTQSNVTAVTIPASDAYGATTFDPGRVNVSTNATVQFQNNDTIEHHPVADDGSWNFDLGPGGSGAQKFTTAGTFSYHCSIHPNMTGTVVVK